MAFHGFFWLRYQLRVGIYMLHTFIREMVIQNSPTIPWEGEETVWRSTYRLKARPEMAILNTIKMIRTQVAGIPMEEGMRSMRAERRGYKPFSQTTAAIPQKKQ